MKMISDQPSEYLLRDKSPPIPKLKAERFLLATTALSMLLALLFVFFVFRETHGAVPHGEPTPLLGVIRLLLALPFLLLFGVVVGSSNGMPRVATLTLSSTAALLALQLVLAAAASYHGRVPNDEYVELFVNILMVSAILMTLFYGSRAARQAAEREVEALRRDPLTGLLNRQEVQTFFEQATTPVTLLMLNLNGFKRVNNLSSHAVGDARLRTAAAALTAALPPDSEAGRWGGDEFLAVLSKCSAA